MKLGNILQKFLAARDNRPATEAGADFFTAETQDAHVAEAPDGLTRYGGTESLSRVIDESNVSIA